MRIIFVSQQSKNKTQLDISCIIGNKTRKELQTRQVVNLKEGKCTSAHSVPNDWMLH